VKALRGPALALLAALPAALPAQEAAAAPEPLLWAYGADDPASIPQAKYLGLNTVMLELTAPLTPEELKRAAAAVRQSERYGLRVIVSLPLTMPDLHSASLSNSEYVEGVTNLVREAARALAEEPNVIGWATGDFLERDLRLFDSEFRDYLLNRYDSVERVEEAWGVRLPSAAAISLEQTSTLDDDLPFATGLPSVDLADFSAHKYAEMLQFWADLVRDATGGRGLLLTGRVTLYRSLPLIPDEYDVIVVSTPPELLERDQATHNVQALDIARGVRGRRVVPCLRLFLPGDKATLQVGQALNEWMAQAALHGAAGVCFEAPPDVLGDQLVQDQWRDSLTWVRDQPAWRSRPRGTAAILYEPYAEGFQALGIPVYGFIKGLSSREPSDLINAFKSGTRHGSVDYLRLEDLSRADLSRYGVIFAPLALNLPDDAQQRLQAYAEEGGVLVADIGAGFAQTGSWAVLPERLATLFGVPPFSEMKNLTGNLTIQRPHPFLPSLPSGATTTGDFEGATHGRRTGAAAYAMNGWTGFAQVPEGVLPFARLAMSVTEDQHPTLAGVFAQDVGLGAAFFATHRLWASWLPQHRLFEPFHADLCARRARIELLDAPFIAPAVQLCESEDESVFLYNPGRALRLQVALYAAEHRLFSGGVCQFTSRLIDATGLRTGAVLATVDVPVHTSWQLQPSPLTVRPYEGVCSALLQRYEAGGIELLVAGEGSGPAGRPGRLSVTPGRPQRVRITLTTGPYPVTPGSRHRVRLTEASGQPSDETLAADDQGRLSIEATVAGARLEIAPE
jgi:hypothetical protein